MVHMTPINMIILLLLRNIVQHATLIQIKAANHRHIHISQAQVPFE